jgi:hypothetical protein
MSNQYLAKQFSGELAQDVINQVQIEYEKSNPLTDYWDALSIQTASDDDLNSIGYIVGYPWPTAPGGTLDSNSFRLSSSAAYPEMSSIGLSGVGLMTGGILSSALPSPNNKVPNTIYRQLLTAIAYAKWHGLSWTTVDAIAASFGTLNYTYINNSYYQFTLGAAATYPLIDTIHGISGIGLSTGGRFSSTNPSYYPDSDIRIAYITPITAANLWICQQIFSAICTAPKVTAQNGA